MRKWLWLPFVLIALPAVALVLAPGRLIIPTGGIAGDSSLVLDYQFAGASSFAGATSTGPVPTYSGGDNRTCWNSSGVLVTLGTDEPCFDHDPSDNTALGLLVEVQRINVSLQSEDLGTTWTNPGANTTITTNAGVAPTGATTADDVLHGDAAETIQQTITATDNTVYTISAFVKQGSTGSHDFVKISWIDESAGDNGFEAWFDLTDCSVGTAQATGTGSYTANSAVARDVGDGWCRISAAGQIVSGQTDARFELINTTADAVDTAEAVNSVFWFGMGAEVGGPRTSYIPTTVSSVTRTVDQVTLPIDGVLPQDAATIIMDWRPIFVGGTLMLFEGTPSASNGISILTSGAGARWLLSDGADAGDRTDRTSTDTSVFAEGVKTEFGLTWDKSLTNLGPLLSIDGVTDAWSAHVAEPQVDFGTLAGIGARNASTTPALVASGHYARLRIYNVAKSQSYINAETTP